MSAIPREERLKREGKTLKCNKCSHIWICYSNAKLVSCPSCCAKVIQKENISKN